MICLTTQEICEATGAAALVMSASTIRGEVVIDSRAVESGSVFVAFKGEQVDGNAYLARAIAAGAGAVVASADVPSDVLDVARASGCAVLRAEVASAPSRLDRRRRDGFGGQDHHQGHAPHGHRHRRPRPRHHRQPQQPHRPPAHGALGARGHRGARLRAWHEPSARDRPSRRAAPATATTAAISSTHR